jgi:hypothetical protein
VPKSQNNSPQLVFFSLFGGFKFNPSLLLLFARDRSAIILLTKLEEKYNLDNYNQFVIHLDNLTLLFYF